MGREGLWLTRRPALGRPRAARVILRHTLAVRYYIPGKLGLGVGGSRALEWGRASKRPGKPQRGLEGAPGPHEMVAKGRGP
jgi:hypothetical protein